MISTSVHGSYSVYRVEALRECLGDKPFIDEFFLYFDDVHPGLKLWSCGYKVIVYLDIVGIHYGGVIKKSMLSKRHIYFRYHSCAILNNLVKTRYNVFKNLLIIKNIIYREKQRKIAVRGLLDGIIKSRDIINKYKDKKLVDASKVPLIRVPAHSILLSLISGRSYRKHVMSYIKHFMLT